MTLRRTAIRATTANGRGGLVPGVVPGVPITCDGRAHRNASADLRGEPSPAASTIPGVDHAGYASKLLESAHALEEELAGLEPERRLQLAATGRIAAVNADLRFTIDLAAAHALTAIALHLTLEQ